ncbi:hypothetical protein BS50DRAFT_630754 [Corynespora cassiicola Philippines]|uniref:Fungal N-terminal domain-containing protein n=1 Tax=Corynespora cassiicola Philippines TaxID=1448308 RepID=A0A2T2NZ79_CORCC|nr:hypothetical protein BS50DRAFT_630754 [Corynespora cassiicola Philippines]
MADPPTVIGAVMAVCNIVHVIGKSISTIGELRSRWKNAGIFFISLASQLTVLRAAMSKIQEWIADGSEHSHHQFVMDLAVTISCCKILLLDKIKIAFGNYDEEELLKLVERHKSSLSLLLNACNFKTLAEQKRLLEKSSSRKTIQKTMSDSASLFVHRDTA